MYKALRLSGFPRVHEGRLPCPEEFSDSQPQAVELFPGEGGDVAKGNITNYLICDFGCHADIARDKSTMFVGHESVWKSMHEIWTEI